MSALRAVSLYSGAGGLDLGMEAAGFQVGSAVESDADCVETLRANRDWPVFPEYIQEVPSESLLEAAGLAPEEPDLLFGGPPCQPFSKCGYWATGDSARLDDPRADTVEAFLRVLRDTRPRAFLMENVTGMAYSGKDEGLQLIRRALEDINRQFGTAYDVEVLILNAADFGVPQTRERVFLIGSRDGRTFGELKPTHRALPGLEKQRALPLDEGLPYWRTAWDALGDLETDEDDPELQPRGKWGDLLPAVPEGQNYLYHTERGEGLPLFGWRRRFWNFLLKIAKDRPSWTLTAQPGPATGPFHWNSRRLSMRELCRLQTFPDDFVVRGDINGVQKQLGNAVPSALAEKLGLEIRARFFGDETARDRPPSLVPAARSDCPPAEPVAPVPDKYLHLVDSDTAHPGTGQGRRAAAE
ncbi:DNA cytosine methyltransferase [Thiohalorhabdus sp. Cl-TMA]|uniref:Cytosine-specific methyltransferase n=1 Tax=Thiohalorhabdus methylotrophus TaxID=3242694 RepID=A0ABV4TR16_9GAMM